MRTECKQTIYFFFWLFEVCDGKTLRSVFPFLLSAASLFFVPAASLFCFMLFML